MENEMRLTETKRWGLDYNGIFCEVVFWTNPNMKDRSHITEYDSRVLEFLSDGTIQWRRRGER